MGVGVVESAESTKMLKDAYVSTTPPWLESFWRGVVKSVALLYL